VYAVDRLQRGDGQRASAERFDNAGRMVGWASVPQVDRPPACPPRIEWGTGRMPVPRRLHLHALVGDGYRRFGASHRRAVLFFRGDYWLLYDVLTGGLKPPEAHGCRPRRTPRVEAGRSV